MVSDETAGDKPGSGSTSEAEMLRVSPQRASQLLENVKNVVKKIESTKPSGKDVRLILVSKLKPANDILTLHTSTEEQSSNLDPRYRLHFGENYAQELTQKAELLPKSIRWHMIGGLQTNKCKPLAEQVENLWCVSSVDTAKKADALEKGRASMAASKTLEHKLHVQVQVNTSGEEGKAGVEPSEAAALCRHIRESCPSLQLSGLMTIGAIARSKELGPDEENIDFTSLRDTRDAVAKELGIESSELELSMGMSSDYETAIKAGSDEIRVGSTIFGERPPKNEATITN